MTNNMFMDRKKFLKPFFLLPLMAAIGLTMACSSGDGNDFYTGKVVRVGTDQVCVGVSEIPKSLQSSPLLNNVISFEKTDLPVSEYKEDMQISFLVVSYEPISQDKFGNYGPRNPQFFCKVKPVR